MVVDIKVWDFRNGVYILYLIDAATRFTKARVIKDKTSRTIIDNIFLMWLSDGPGCPRRFLSDNGKEFANYEFQEMCELLNILELKTAVEAPWSNGLCERNHAIVDNMIHKLLEDNPDCPLERALAWACHAKNTLQMKAGFSPFQLVFGQNPKLPGIADDQLPALHRETQSQILADHINAMKKARKLFLEADSSTRVRQALNSRIREGKTVETGEKVYYKRDDSKKWKGPGNVIGNNGRTVFIDHGGHIQKVHDSRVTAPIDEVSPGKVACDDAKNLHLSDQSDNEEINIPSETPTHEKAEKGESLPLEDSNSAVPDFISVKRSNEKVCRGKEINIECENGVIMNGVVLSRAGKATAKHCNWWNVQKENGEVVPIDLGKVKEFNVANIAEVSVSTNEEKVAKNKELEN